MDINYDFKNRIESKKESNFEQDSEEILRQISQITPSEDKSFDSPVIFSKNRPIFNDYNIDINQIAKENNISSFSSINEKYNKRNDTKNENTLNDDNNNNILINNKQITLNQKLKYLCSLIQISNINIRKYDDLRQFKKYLEDKNSIINIFEPINLLFDIINELIFVIQKELRNNDILMKELKRLRYNRNNNEREIYKLKMIIKDKDKELNELRILKNDEYYKYNENEINELKNENKELYKKINTYKLQVKKAELNNNEIKNRLQSFNTDKIIIKNNNIPFSNKINLVKKNITNIIPNIYTINDINNNNNNKFNQSCFSFKKNNCHNSENKILNKNKNYSASKNNFKNLSQNNTSNDSYSNTNNNNIDIYNSSNNSFNNGRSIITNLMFLLKEINDLLNVYNSSLSAINIGNNNINKINEIENKTKNENNNNQSSEEKNNINAISNDFINKINNVIKNIKYYMKEENKDKLNKKLIYVNTSKWKFRKKSHNKKNNQKIKNNNEENENSSLSLSNKKNIPNKMNLKLFDKDNYINNEEEYNNKIIEHYTHSNIHSSINTYSLNVN